MKEYEPITLGQTRVLNEFNLTGFEELYKWQASCLIKMIFNYKNNANYLNINCVEDGFQLIVNKVLERNKVQIQRNKEGLQ